MNVYPSMITTMATNPLKDREARSFSLDSSPALGDFLRAHRERLSPQEIGIPLGLRRRTPGLRREEVAQLCGVSATWYTWIEQGRSVSASPEALARIALALRLSKAERSYLFELANQHDPDAANPTDREIPPALSSILRLLKTPTYVLDRQWNAIAWNSSAKLLFVGWLTSEADHNLLRYIFLSPASRRLVVDWESRARRVVAEFRADSSRYMKEEPTKALIQDLLHRSSHFRQFWKAQDVFEREGGLRQFQHPQRGRLTYDQITMRPSAHEDLKLVVLTPIKKSRAS